MYIAMSMVVAIELCAWPVSGVATPPPSQMLQVPTYNMQYYCTAWWANVHSNEHGGSYRVMRMAGHLGVHLRAARAATMC